MLNVLLALSVVALGMFLGAMGACVLIAMGGDNAKVDS